MSETAAPATGQITGGAAGAVTGGVRLLLRLEGLTDVRLAVGETKPQRIGPRRFSPFTEMMVSTIWLGATL